MGRWPFSAVSGGVQELERWSELGSDEERSAEILEDGGIIEQARAFVPDTNWLYELR